MDVWPRMQHASLFYVDTATPMLGRDGTPMPALFLELDACARPLSRTGDGEPDAVILPEKNKVPATASVTGTREYIF